MRKGKKLFGKAYNDSEGFLVIYDDIAIENKKTMDFALTIQQVEIHKKQLRKT